jgi:hypothetical protein
MRSTNHLRGGGPRCCEYGSGDGGGGAKDMVGECLAAVIFYQRNATNTDLLKMQETFSAVIRDP